MLESDFCSCPSLWILCVYGLPVSISSLLSVYVACSNKYCQHQSRWIFYSSIASRYGKAIMPLLQFYTSPNQLSQSEQDHLVAVITTFYARLFPAFFVIIIFNEVYSLALLKLNFLISKFDPTFSLCSPHDFINLNVILRVQTNRSKMARFSLAENAPTRNLSA